MEKDCVLNRERKGLRIKVKSSFSSISIKEGMEAAEKAAPYVYISGDLTKETDGYCVYIRQKISLKEYLTEEKIDTDIIYTLMTSLRELWKASEKEGLEFYNFLFDYDAVFLDCATDCMEFVYLPGSRLNRQNNSVKDMIVLLLLQCIPDESETAELLSMVADEMEKWEEGEGVFPEIPIKIGFTGKKLPKISSRWNPFCLVAVIAFLIAGMLFFLVRNLWVWPVWLVLSVGAILYTVPGKKPALKIVRKIYLKGGPEFRNGEITVGRDYNWADFRIDNLMISRRHAVIIEKKQSLAVRDLFSSNGTYVDGKRLESGEEVDIYPGQKLCFGKSYVFGVKSKISILLLKR